MTLGVLAGLAAGVIFLICLWGLSVAVRVHNGDIEL